MDRLGLPFLLLFLLPIDAPAVGPPDSADIGVAVELPSNGAEPIVTADVIPTEACAVAVYASLDAAYPWHGNDVDWSATPIAADPDTTGAGDSTEPRHFVVVLPEGWEDDVVHVAVRIKVAGELVDTVTYDAVLDPPLDLRTVAWIHDGEAPAAAIAAGWVPDHSDSSAYYDVILTADDNIRYAVFDRDTPLSPVRPTYFAGSCTRSRHNTPWHDSAAVTAIWYNMEFLPDDAEILFSRLYLVNEGGETVLWNAQYFAAVLDTVAGDRDWLAAPPVAYDPHQLSVAFDQLNTASAAPWVPDLDDRDDLFDIGPLSGRWQTDLAANEPWHLDLVPCDQHYVDAGPARVNAGYWLFRTNDADGVQHQAGVAIELGEHTTITQQPIKIMQYVVDPDRDRPWGWGRHRVPVALVLDDLYDIHAEWAAIWGEEETSLALNGDWVDGYDDSSPGHLTAAELSSLRDAGVRMLHHGYDHSVGMGDITEPAKWYWQTRRTMFLDLFGDAYGDTINPDIDSFVWIGAGTESSMDAIEWLVENHFTSARGYSGTLDDAIGTQTPLAWYRAVNAYHLHAWNIGLWHPASTEDALEMVGEAVDDAVEAGHECLIWWTHTESEPAEFSALSQAVDDLDYVTKVPYADAVGLRFDGRSPAAPDPAWLPDPSGIDAVWLGGESWMDHCWYPPRDFVADDVGVGVPEATTGPPPGCRLDPNVPNPFNPRTGVRFWLGAEARARIRLYDVRGRLVRRLLDERLPVGEHRVTWDGRDEDGRRLSSGVYLCRLSAHGRTVTRKLVLVK